MKLYALSVAAMQAGEPSSIGVQTAIAALPDDVSVEDADMQIARDMFPEADGWGQYYVSAVEITQGFPLAPYRLVWHLETSEQQA